MTDGVLVVDKPSGPTSHDVVNAARRLYGTRDVGHAGTLDPLATGVLVLLFGEATKLGPYLSGEDKSYLATVAFGSSTDTLDAEGSVTEERVLAPGWLAASALAAALDAERARREQTPPLFSAVKVQGRRAHRIGRRGGSVELATRPVRIERIELVERDDRQLVALLNVSKGYYVRAFARDLGAALGVPAHLSALRRLASGRFMLAEAVAWPAPEPVPLVPVVDAAQRALPSALLTDDGSRRARLGQPLARAHFADDPGSVHAGEARVAWLSPEGELVAIGSGKADRFSVVRGFGAGLAR